MRTRIQISNFSIEDYIGDFCYVSSKLPFFEQFKEIYKKSCLKFKK